MRVGISTREDNFLKLKLSNSMEIWEILNMVVGARQTGLSMSETPDLPGYYLLQAFPRFTKNGKKNRENFQWEAGMWRKCHADVWAQRSMAILDEDNEMQTVAQIATRVCKIPYLKAQRLEANLLEQQNSIPQTLLSARIRKMRLLFTPTHQMET